MWLTPPLSPAPLTGVSGVHLDVELRVLLEVVEEFLVVAELSVPLRRVREAKVVTERNQKDRRAKETRLLTVLIQQEESSETTQGHITHNTWTTVTPGPVTPGPVTPGNSNIWPRPLLTFPGHSAL